MYVKNRFFRGWGVVEAISDAIKKDEIMRGVLRGRGKPATGPYKPGTWAYNDKVKSYSYDPAKARELLKQAGWADANGDGLLDKDGRSFAFEILTNQGNETRQTCAEIIPRQLAEVGIEPGLALGELLIGRFHGGFEDVAQGDDLHVGMFEEGRHHLAAAVGRADAADAHPIVGPQHLARFQSGQPQADRGSGLGERASIYFVAHSDPRSRVEGEGSGLSWPPVIHRGLNGWTGESPGKTRLAIPSGAKETGDDRWLSSPVVLLMTLCGLSNHRTAASGPHEPLIVRY